MTKYLSLLALVGLTACATHEGFIYEVTDSSPEEVRIQVHKNSSNMSPDKVAKRDAHMLSLARRACRGHGKGEARFKREYTYTGGLYYSWLVKVYDCA